MHKIFGAAALLAASLLAFGVEAASVTFGVQFSGPTSMTPTCAGGTGPFSVPVAAGTVICPIVVPPSNWTGTIALTQPTAGQFVLTGAGCNPGTSTGCSVAVGANPITTTGTINLTVTTLP